jgi:diguanylate cyclase (GGDEF)-like protein
MARTAISIALDTTFFAKILRRILYGFTALAILAFALYVYVSLRQERQVLLTQIATQAEFTAATSQSFFDNIGHSLELASLQVTNKYALTKKRELFNAILKRHPEVAFISAFDVNGTRLLTTFTDQSLITINPAVLSSDVLPKKFADNFAWLQDSIKEAHPYSVGRNEFGKLIHQWRIPVRYVKRTADGKIDFIVQASIPITRQTSLWSNLGLLPDTRIGIYRDDGYAQTRWPDIGLDPNMLYGSNELPCSPMEDVVKAKRTKGYYEGFNSINKDYRVGAYSRLPRLPLTAFVSVPSTLVYKNWWQHNYALVITLGILFLVFFGIAQLLLMLERKHSADLSRKAHIDALTELPNRQAGERYLAQRLSTHHHIQKPFAVLFVDLDEFKYINDRFGHRYGDLVLRHVTSRLVAQLREHDVLARLGGDEFMAIIECDNTDQAKQIACRMQIAMQEPIAIEQQQFTVSLSIGISLFPQNGTGAQELLNKADAAMYTVKNSSRNGYAFFSEEMNDECS